MEVDTFTIKADPRNVSDGHHTFHELYQHRHMLTLVLMKSWFKSAWFSRFHVDGGSYDGWFLVGIDLPTGTVTYHLPELLFDAAAKTGAKLLTKAPEWDGHTSDDVIHRLLGFAISEPC